MSRSPVPKPGSEGGWQARLELEFRRASSRTELARRRHFGPLLVQRAFYPEQAPTCHVYILHPPGGVVSGDELELDVDVHAHAHVLLTTPAAGKFYRRGPRSVARLSQTLRVDGGVLEWLPQENIFYPEAAVELRTIVRLSATARFIGWEIGCLGLPASRQSLGDGTVRQSFELWRGEAPLLIERHHIERACLEARWGLAGHSSLGTWIAYPADAGHLQKARTAVSTMDCADLTLACTLIDGMLICRAYAGRSDRLKQRFIELWNELRPALLGRPAVTPRIWTT
jgi:urease accessory protein